jgi:hypothetical protein
MPNAVTYSDEKTPVKVIKALVGSNDLELDQVLAAMERLQAAGILFREEPEARAPRTAAEAAAEAKALEAPEGGVHVGASGSSTVN